MTSNLIHILHKLESYLVRVLQVDSLGKWNYCTAPSLIIECRRILRCFLGVHFEFIIVFKDGYCCYLFKFMHRIIWFRNVKWSLIFTSTIIILWGIILFLSFWRLSFRLPTNFRPLFRWIKIPTAIRILIFLLLILLKPVYFFIIINIH